LGTPAIAYNVPGLKDSIENNKTGLLVNSTNRELAYGTIQILKNTALREKLSNNCLEYSKTFNWDKSANEFLRIIRGV